MGTWFIIWVSLTISTRCFHFHFWRAKIVIFCFIQPWNHDVLVFLRVWDIENAFVVDLKNRDIGNLISIRTRKSLVRELVRPFLCSVFIFLFFRIIRWSFLTFLTSETSKSQILWNIPNFWGSFEFLKSAVARKFTVFWFKFQRIFKGNVFTNPRFSRLWCTGN